MNDTQALLAEYATRGSEPAFRELVTRYTGLVYATALRLVDGDTHLAEDVAQTVFADLARLATSLPKNIMLGGWLHQRTFNVAAPMMRAHRRRQSREREAAQMNSLPDDSRAHLAQVEPLLDEAITQLGAEDRTAIILRFFERRDFRSIGEALGSNEDAARMRVTRALDKLQLLLKRRGAALSAAALGTALASESVTAAPIGLAASLSTAALAAPPAAAATTLTLIKTMAMTKLEVAVISAIVIGSVVTPLALQHQSANALREQDEILRRNGAQLAALQTDNARLAGLRAQPGRGQTLSSAEFAELLKLRGEVGRLGRDVQELSRPKPAPAEPPMNTLASMEARSATQVSQVRQWLVDHPSELIPEMKYLTDSDWINYSGNLNSVAFDKDEDYQRVLRIVRANAEHPYQTILRQALRQYVEASQGQFPSDLSQLRQFFKSPIEDEILQRYTIVPASSLVPELQTGSAWVITERAPVNPTLDLRVGIGLTNMMMADERVTNRWSLNR